MHCQRLKNIHNKKRHNRALKQKEKRFYRNVQNSGNDYRSKQSYRTEAYRFLYKQCRRKNKTISQNKRYTDNNIKRKFKVGIDDSDIVLPRHIDFYLDENRNATIDAILNIFNFKKEKILIDFSNVHTMSAAATAMLFSTIKHIKLNFKKQISIILPVSKKIQATVKQIKLLDFLDIQNSIEVNHYKDVSCWYAKNGHQYPASKYISEMVNGIIENSENSNTNIEKYRKSIDITIGEALLNIDEHAYLDSDLSFKNWVFFAQFSNDEKKLILVMADSGIGVARTFKKYLDQRDPAWTSIKKFFKKENDYIKQAVTNLYEIPKKKGDTNIKEGRGTGLTKIYQNVKNTDKSSLQVYSHKGYFSSMESSIKFKEYFPGTVIELTINYSIKPLK